MAAVAAPAVIVFGCCVGAGRRFEAIAEPALSRLMRPEDEIVALPGTDGICAVYNRVLRHARRRADCEAVVLLHDDTELVGGHTRDRLLRAVRRRGVGVVGVAGGRDLFGPQWWYARRRVGRVVDHTAPRRFLRTRGDVDVVDGLVLVLAPAAFGSLDFDEQGLRGYHGYDTDYCLRVREAGLRVRVEPLDYVHRDKQDLGDEAAYDGAQRLLLERWQHRIRPLTPEEAARAQRRAERGRRLRRDVRRVRRRVHRVATGGR